MGGKPLDHNILFRYENHIKIHQRQSDRFLEGKVDSYSGVTVEHGWFSCFLVEMLVVTAESKADFFFFLNNPWEATDGGNQEIGSGEEGWRTFCSMGTRIHPLWWAAVHPGFNTCAVLSWVCPLLHWESLLRQEGQGLIRRFVRVSVTQGREGNRD